MQSLAIIAMSLAAAVTYGILHDQVTARVCLEYFTIGHPRIIDSQSPTLLALVWGVVATWWLGLPLGILLAIAARFGRHPKRSARSLVRPLAILLAVTAAAAFVAGLVGYDLAAHRDILLRGDIALDVPTMVHPAFLADSFAHSASYTFGCAGGLVLVALVYWSRVREGELRDLPGRSANPKRVQ